MIEMKVDSRKSVGNKIHQFMHCRECIEEKPFEARPRDWMRFEIGLTDEGTLQIWCVRHECNVAEIYFEEEVEEYVQ